VFTVGAAEVFVMIEGVLIVGRYGAGGVADVVIVDVGPVVVVCVEGVFVVGVDATGVGVDVGTVVADAEIDGVGAIDVLVDTFVVMECGVVDNAAVEGVAFA
jgi:hypothetical protein